MKRITLLLSLLLIPAALLAGSFEGKIRFSAKSPKHDQATFCDYSLKPGFLRIDFAGHDSESNERNIVSIWDLNHNKLFTLMPDQKTYLVMKTAAISASAPGTAPAVQFGKTGETETILGYPASKYVFKDAAHSATDEVWAVEGFGPFLTVRSAFVKHGVMSPLEKELASRSLFPLRIVFHSSGGAETSRLEAVSVDKQALPDNTFTLPGDYHLFDANSLSGGF
jgi:hypothetical protein